MNNLTLTREKLVNHDIYEMLDAPEKIRVFMQHHVFAVWDFMSLLKRLQRDLTCVELPWRVKLPTQNTQFARFINEIVIGEETDEDGSGGFISHFELYLQAMRECGADTSQIELFLQHLANNGDVEKSLALAEVPESVSQFVKNTINLATNGKTHEVCASFFFGREELIPDMFQVIVDELSNNGQKPERLLYYLNRHIEMDGDEHGPLTQKLFDYLCDNDETKIKEAEQAALTALNSRIELWNGVCASFDQNSKTATF
ncbi:MAG: DUF3050 domain-containing protein [Pyrinomonadaceae bacterium]|nr:DUF3050 domain-containing protein [Pyrinomonadaceae bacterium]